MTRVTLRKMTESEFESFRAKLIIEYAAANVSVGRWSAGGAWIYDIEVMEDHRGKGYGRAILHAAEQETLKNGVNSIGLNVFGTNTVARSLYESAGYEITAQQMQKEITPS